MVVVRSSAQSSTIAGKKFVDGWVEFAEKKIAKRVTRSLNGTPIGLSCASVDASTPC